MRPMRIDAMCGPCYSESDKYRGERSVPLLLGLANYDTSFGGLKGRGRLRDIRHEESKY
jgi:hypothetical protein